MSTDKTQHRPFWDGKFRGLWDSFQHSPYPLHYTLRWPLYFRYPSLRNHSGLRPLPARFVHPAATACADADTLKLLFAGDIMVLNGDRPPVLCEALRSLIQHSDYFVASLEAPVGRHAPSAQKRYTFQFHMPFTFLASIQQQTSLPFDRWILSNANNHAGDAGVDGFRQSFETLEAAGVHAVGWNHDTRRCSIRAKGLNVGFTAWTHWLNRDLAEGGHRLVTAGDVDRYVSLDAKLRSGVDYLIGLPHWEYEFQHFPQRATRHFARSLLARGTDLLVGSHPHVLQPYERSGNGYCFYSLGNFCGLGIAWPAKIITLLEVHLARTGETRRATLLRFAFHHFYQLHVGDEIRLVALDDLPDAQRTRARQRIARLVDHATVA